MKLRISALSLPQQFHEYEWGSFAESIFKERPSAVDCFVGR